MVPVEARAFALLAACVILLAAVLIAQWIPSRPVVPKPVVLLVLVVVIALGVLVLVTTSQ